MRMMLKRLDHVPRTAYRDRPRSDQPLTSICTCTCIMGGQERREARLSRRRERERNRVLESAEEREARLVRRRVRDRALRAAQSTAQREEALQRRRERGFRAEFTYVRTYVHVYIRLYGRICAAISKLAQARPTMPVFLQ